MIVVGEEYQTTAMETATKAKQIQITMIVIKRRYSIIEKQIIIGDTVLEFEYPIDDYFLEICGILVISLEVPDGVIFTQNVFGISLLESKIKWQIKKRIIPFSEGQNCPCMSIFLDENRQLRADYWCNTYFILDPFTGEILQEGLIR